MWRGDLGFLRPSYWIKGVHYTVRADQSPEDGSAELVSQLQNYGVPALSVGLDEPDFDRNQEDPPDPESDLGLPHDGLLWTVFSGTWMRDGANGWREKGLDWDVESIQGLMALTRHRNSSVRAWATSWLVRRHGDDPLVTTRLIEVANTDERSNVRQAAVASLAHRCADPGVPELLSTMAAGDPSYLVRWWGRFGLTLRSSGTNSE